MADVVRHDDLADFWAATEGFFGGDPVFHTVPIAAVHRRLAHPDPSDRPPLLLTVAEQGEVVAAAVRTPPWPLTLSGVPARWADVVAEELAGTELDGVNGPRPEAEAFVRAWTARTGCDAREVMALRLFRLEGLAEPTGVPGTSRAATEADAELLVRWYLEFVDESTPYDPDEEHAWTYVRGTLSFGAGHHLWLHDGEPVSWACAGRPASGMSRIGPVFTPEQHRRNGYAEAVTSACARWALGAGAEHVVLYTDLANPTSNSIYQRLGFRPVCDAAEFAFTPPDPA
ncbi:GNAT family N-acetyltransferase [Actinosynnema sp. NPDC047251]|uniref:GNAT family N-acetyltransferase n=1 Tax=Saccharothrix espanaensis TaxID=103731 RepID=UPI0011DD1E73|nr:GNAT family N-acetyltransferase [Saccharothrix espanaensis]